MNEEHIKSIVDANILIIEDMLNNGNLSVEELQRVSNRMGDLIENLSFWFEQNNSDRFFYELKIYLNWLLENYS
jgi:hypothetical protein